MNTARNTKTEHNVKLLYSVPNIEFCIFDTETTGTDPQKDRIVQLSAIKLYICNGQAKEKNRLNTYINPEMLMSDKVISIHGITNEFIKDYKTESEQFESIYSFFGDSPIVVGHNIGFDNNFLKTMYERYGKAFNPAVSIDTLECARDLIPYTDIENYKLQTILNNLGINAGLKFHDSMDDVMGCLRLLNAMHAEYINPSRKVGPHKNKIRIKFIKFVEGFNSIQKGTKIWSWDDEKIWYSNKYKFWVSANTDLGLVDIDDLENQVLNKLGLTLEELGRMNAKKFQSLCKPGRTTIS